MKRFAFIDHDNLKSLGREYALRRVLHSSGLGFSIWEGETMSASQHTCWRCGEIAAGKRIHWNGDAAWLCNDCVAQITDEG